MKVLIENIGLISKAEIDINNIALIASENDSGKSTVGKALFSTIYSVNSNEEEIINSLVVTINSFRHFLLITHDSNFKKEISSIRQCFDKIFYEIKEFYSSKKDIESIFLKIKNIILEIEEIEARLKKHKYRDIEKINTITHMTELIKQIKVFENIEKMKSISFQRNLQNEFETGIKNIFDDKNTFSSISLQDKNIFVDINLENDRVVKIETREDKSNKYNVLYIETPVILDYMDDICIKEYPLQFMNNSKENYKIKFLRKCLNSKKEMNLLEEVLGKKELLEKVRKNIEDAINGKIEYDLSSEKYVYQKNGKKIEIKNTANGIKAFGILEMLLKNGYLDKNTILIIDEPEVHLHPNWQIKYAELLNILSKELEVKILINSHSPYFIEAMKIYSDEYTNNTKFYTIEDNPKNKYSKISVDKTEKMEDIYNKLAEAYKILTRVKYKKV